MPLLRPSGGTLPANFITHTVKRLFQKIFKKTETSLPTLVEVEIGNSWQIFDSGKTIRTKGSENGKIILDQENIDGARITLEENANKIPFAITIGIYGLMCHTEFFSNLDSATEYIKRKKIEINEIFKMYDVESEKRDSNWDDKHEILLENLIYK